MEHLVKGEEDTYEDEESGNQKDDGDVDFSGICLTIMIWMFVYGTSLSLTLTRRLTLLFLHSSDDGYAYQYEVTFPPGMMYHSFYCEQYMWCKTWQPKNPGFVYITIEYAYLLDQETITNPLR
jgi:hypothetical protein